MRKGLVSLLGLSCFVISPSARAWIESEHVELGACVVEDLGASDDDGRAAIAAIAAAWSAARTIPPEPAGAAPTDARPLGESLCADPIRPYQGQCVSLPELPMLAGDHACSPGELAIALRQPWTTAVLADTLATRDALIAIDDRYEAAKALPLDPVGLRRVEDHVRADRLRVRRDADVQLQADDPRYLDRAGGGAAHFVQPRAGAMDTFEAFLHRTLDPRPLGETAAPMSATAAYAGYHALALRFALGFRDGGRKDPRLAFWALLYESFALHFLEDAFSAGHFVGASPENAERMGTHDYYSVHGVDVTLWSGALAYAAHGDAYMGPEDKRRATAALARSLRQLGATLAGAGRDLPSPADLRRLYGIRLDPALSMCPDPARPDVPVVVDVSWAGVSDLELIRPILRMTPRSATADPGVAHFRTEYGPFVPLGVSLDGAGIVYASGDAQPTVSVRIGAGIGYASDGAISELKDGLVFLMPMGSLATEGFLTSTFGFGFQFRVPYAYVPGDVLLWGPLSAAKTRAGFEMANRAFGGGHVHYLGSTARLELDLGREASFLWSFRQEHVPGTTTSTTRYVRWEATIPFVTLRVLHSFQDTLANEFSVRLGARLGSERSHIQGVDPGSPDLHGFFGGVALTLTDTTRFYIVDHPTEPVPTPSTLKRR